MAEGRRVFSDATQNSQSGCKKLGKHGSRKGAVRRARYLDPRTSRWLSADPALSDYIPLAPVNDEAKKHNQNLPGMGGVFNVVNFHLYHYAGNNPVKYTDPDGKALHVFIGAAIGATVGAGTTAIKDMLSGQVSDLSTYAGAIAGGAVSGAILAATGNGTLAGAAGAGIGNITKQTINIAGGKQENFEAVDLIADVAIGTAFGKLCSADKVPGVTSGKGSMQAVAKQLTTKLEKGIIKNVSAKSSIKIAVSRTVKGVIIRGTLMGMMTKEAIEAPIVKPLQKQLDKVME